MGALEHTMQFRPFMRVVLLLLIVTVLPVGAGAQPAPGGPPAVGVVRAERQQITETDEFIGRIQSVGPGGARCPGQRVFSKSGSLSKAPRSNRAISSTSSSSRRFRRRWRTTRPMSPSSKRSTRNAQLTLERAQYLLKTVAGQQSTVDSALASERSLAAQIEAAKAQLQIAEINLGYTEIRAPIDGKISATDVTEGNVVSPTTGTLANLVSQDPMYVLYPVSVRAGLDLRKTATRQRAASAQSCLRSACRMGGSTDRPVSSITYHRRSRPTPTRS